MSSYHSRVLKIIVLAAFLPALSHGQCDRGGDRDFEAPKFVQNCGGGGGGGGGIPPISGPAAASSAQTAQMNGLVLQSGITTEATKSSWSCGSSSGDGKGCFLRTGKYVVDVVKSCAPCYLNFAGSDSNGDGVNDITISVPIHGKDVTVAKGDATKCPGCITATTNTPKCGGTFFGIGSKKKARSCKLIDEAGCWPDSTRRVIHDCGAGNECAYKVTDAKAKIWCCRPKETAFFKKWRNVFRCRSMALSKSKDRNGAVILFE